MKGLFPLLGKKTDAQEEYYENSTQKWLPLADIKNGIIVLKDGRYIKLIEVLPVNFYLKSEVEQENIIFYFASYLKIAPDNMQIRVLSQRADIEEYLERLNRLSKNEQNESCRSMMYDEMEFVKGLSDNTAVKKRFFIVLEYSVKAFSSRDSSFSEAVRFLSDEAYKAQRYLSQCGLEVLDISDNEAVTDLLYTLINKHTSKYVKPGSYAQSTHDEIHTYERGETE
ncbi:MAG: hypothetical protein BWY15_02252 [Firmicutes bacterium ADurb.Bin193]|nr:MAG: hypothetical protein BWY15_02252 [Firmicutes bacterium ADurb.Bin193]